MTDVVRDTNPDLAQWVVGVYENDPLPENCEVVRLLSVEQHPWGTGTGSRRYYVLLVQTTVVERTRIGTTYGWPWDALGFWPDGRRPGWWPFGRRWAAGHE